MAQVALRTLIIVLFSLLLAACPVADVVGDPPSSFHLEIANRTSQDIVFSFSFEGGIFYLNSKDVGWKDIGTRGNSGKIELSQGERVHTFIRLEGTGVADNKQISYFMKVSFYGSSSDTTPSISYDYTNSEGGSSYDKKGIWVKTDGSRENLFEKSSARPFYFAYDYDDSELAHMYITRVP